MGDARTERPTNRDRKRAAKRGMAWCASCDHYTVWDGQRCPNCGRRSLPMRDKK